MLDHFTREELQCKCCETLTIQDEMKEKLTLAREIADIPFHVNCMYRCENHNKEVGGAPDSMHLRGGAIDVHCPDHIARYKMVKAFLQAGFNTIIIYPTFIHADIRPTEERKPILKVSK